MNQKIRFVPKKGEKREGGMKMIWKVNEGIPKEALGSGQ